MCSKDNVKMPEHYAGDGEVDCMRAMRSMMEGYAKASVKFGYSRTYWILCCLKYIWRAPLKNGVEDLEKARQCLKYAIREKDKK